MGLQSVHTFEFKALSKGVGISRFPVTRFKDTIMGLASWALDVTESTGRAPNRNPSVVAFEIIETLKQEY